MCGCRWRVDDFIRWLDKDVAQIDVFCFQDAFKMILNWEKIEIHMYVWTAQCHFSVNF